METVVKEMIKEIKEIMVTRGGMIKEKVGNNF
jgi:hypothetical protein